METIQIALRPGSRLGSWLGSRLDSHAIRRRLRTGRAQLLVPLLTCALGIGCVLLVDTDTTDDGASVLPLIALAGVAIALVRHRPDIDADPIRPVARQMAIVTLVASTALIAGFLMSPDSFPTLFGPAVTTALLGSYLATWGLRSPALMRTVTLLSLLTWSVIARAVHEIVRSSLEQPSDMIYRRLAGLSALRIADEPWRLHTATLHHGALVVIATVVLVVAITRQRFTPTVIVETLATATVSLVIHHIVVLSSPLDEYQPDDVAQVASHPALEIGIAAVGVMALIAYRWRRHANDSHNSTTTVTPDVATADAHLGRDPFIFDVEQPAIPITVSAMLFSGAAAFAVLVTLVAT